jgi:serine/threonine protein kinase
MPLFPGQRLGRYEIIASVGPDGMGDVSKARDAELGREVAIKTSADRDQDAAKNPPPD